MKKIYKFLILFLILFLGIFNNSFANSCQEHSLKGYAWSDGIGWISFDCKTPGSNINYGVDVAKNGNLSGYAWSDAVGWISFDYYTSEDSHPKYNKNTKKLEGYIKALGGLEESDDNWNGKISLSGTSSNGSTYAPEYNFSTFEFSKYAWGGNNVGWIDFKTSYGSVIMDPFYFVFNANKGNETNPVDYNGSVILSWTTEGADSCVASNGSGTSWTNNINKAIGNPTTVSETISSLTSDKLFSLTCTDSYGNNLKKDIDVKVKPPAPELYLYSDDNNIASNASTTLHWNIKNVENCKLTSSTGIDENINSSNGIHDRNSGNLTDSTNWFKVSCDSNEPTYYPNKIEEIIYIDVEKLILEFYPETPLIKFNDKIKLYWKPEFAVSCLSSGDISDFNSDFNSDSNNNIEGLHSWESNKQETEGISYDQDIECTGTVGQKVKKTINIKVGKNPKYQEI